MIYEDITVSGSISISGSFNVPQHASTASANQATGSLFFDTSAKLFKVFQSGAGAINVASQPFTPEPPAVPYSVDFLVIAGGGGGNCGGGGAGAGGYRNSYGSEASGGGGSSESSLTFNPGTVYTITVGAGGAAGANSSDTATLTGNSSAGDASSLAGSDITDVTTVGGGAGT